MKSLLGLGLVTLSAVLCGGPADATVQTQREFWLGNDLVKLPLDKDAKPDFMLVGTAKAGSTSFFDHMVHGHPMIEPPVKKELHFFNNAHCGLTRDLTDFTNMMPLLDTPKVKRGGKITGEGTPVYITYPCALEQIQALNPDVKLIIMLRDPLARAVAEWRFSGTRDFEKTIKEEKAQIDAALAVVPNGTDLDISVGIKMPTWRRIRRGFYTPQLELLDDIFGLKNVLVIQSERYFAEPVAVLEQVDRFLGVDPALRQHNVTLKASQHTHRAGHFPPPLPESIDFLRRVFKPSLERLYAYLEERPFLTGGVRFRPYNGYGDGVTK